MSKLHLITYGCQMNEYDSERVAGLLKQERYELTDRPEDADLILLNTCSIREKAEDKVFSQLGALRHLKRERPDLVIGVMGCMAQLQKGRIQERAPYVDLVFGSPAIARVAELVGRAKQGRGPVLETGEGALVKITARPEGGLRLKAFVTVMEGCEKYCTFCVVPTTRGRERSHAPEAIVEEIRGLAAAGCREVTLLGQTVNAYGRDLSPPTDLAALLERVNDIDGIERIRFTTSNPYNLTPRLIRAIRDVPKVCEYLHLPLQSGSDRVLERMNRGYTRARYLELIAELQGDGAGPRALHRSHRGLPRRDRGGLRADGGDGRGGRLRQRVRLPLLPPAGHARGGDGRSGAGRGQGRPQPPHPGDGDPRGRRAQPAPRGPDLPVLVDGVSRKNAGEAAGRTRCNRVVNFDPGGRDLLGRVVPVRVVRALPHSLRGELEV